MNKKDFKHNFPLDVRWSEADVLGHINNVEFLRYIEAGRVDYCSDVMDMIIGVGVKSGWILADIRCTYRQQVHYPCSLEICSSITKVGNKSATITAHLYRKGEADPVVTSEGVMVWFDYELQKTTTIPDTVRQQVAAYEKPVKGE